jgi:Reverse transcriptase (RNA-dependent DNA polymerase)
MPLEQHGFTSNCSSDQCLHTLINIISEAKCNNSELFCLYIDFAKAFDSVEHWVLKDIFDHIGLGKLEKAIMKTLIRSQTKIETEAGFTEFITFKKGTKQGDIISPTLFTLFIAPLLWLLHHSLLGYSIANSIISALTVAELFMEGTKVDLGEYINF